MKELFLFVRPPRAIWPFNGPSTAFWPPLAFVSLAAALRESLKDLDVAILDCPALQMGWKSLSREMERLRPSYVAIGEEAVSAVEGLRLARMAKVLGARVIAGGCTYGNLAKEIVSTGLVDVVVRGEGERTIVEAVQALRDSNELGALSQVAGVAFAHGGEYIVTPARKLIANLDELPMPAWDLLPMTRYGAKSRNHPNLATIEHSRGCIGSCGFCVLWRQMAEEKSGTLEPCYRTKSPERVMEEVRTLVRGYGRRYLCWVDPCFNADAAFLEGFAEGMLREGVTVGQSAWVRTDCLERDERSGLLGRLAETGLNEIFVGVERVDESDLVLLDRSAPSGRAAGIIREITQKHPSLYVVGSFIYGLPGDSWRTVKAMRDATIDLNLDMAFYIPLTRLPGTAFWNKSLWDGSGNALQGMNFLTTGPEGNGARRLTWLLAASVLLDVRPKRLAYALGCLLTQDARKRRMHRRLMWRGAGFALKRLAAPALSGGVDAMKRPRWYDQ